MSDLSVVQDACLVTRKNKQVLRKKKFILIYECLSGTDDKAKTLACLALQYPRTGSFSN